MYRSRWIFAVLLFIFAIAAVYVGSDPEMSSRYAQAVRDADLSAQAKDLVLTALVIAVGGYLAWFVFMRRQ
jgi:multisubunit Na+/H+ antiporter MnhC subunit